MLNAKNGVVEIEDTLMDYIVFGKGKDVLIMIPGLSDALTSVKGMALPIAWSYRKFAKDYRVYLFSRKRKIPKIYTSRDMSHDLVYALKKLGVEKANVLGVSQGGTIAQFVSIDYPEFVSKLILTVTYPRANDTVKSCISKWISLAEKSNYHDLIIDVTEKTYTENYLKIIRKGYPILTRYKVPKSYNRFITMASACAEHDAYDMLSSITCPTLIIGGTDDKIVTGNASLELSQLIPNSFLHMYEGQGHGAFEEKKDFQDMVLKFLID